MRPFAMALYFAGSFARVEWSFAWPGRGIEFDSSVPVIDFIGASFAFAVVPGPTRSVTDDAGGTGDVGVAVAVGAPARLSRARSHAAKPLADTSTNAKAINPAGNRGFTLEWSRM